MNALKIFFSIGCLIAALNFQTAYAQMVVFPDRTAFDLAFPGASVENWDSYANGTVITNGSTLNGITYSTNNSNSVLVTNLYLASSGSQGLGETGVGYFVASNTITFSFAQPLTSFAIDINTFATNNGAFTATVNNGAVISLFDPFPGYSSGEFIGFSDTTPFYSVTIEDPSGFGYTLDTMMYVDPPASVVPEPSTVALMIIGLIGVAVFTLRRKIS